MAEYFVAKQNDPQPLAQWPAIYYEINKRAKSYVAVFDYDEYITDRQRRWYKGICLKGLSDWNGDTVDEWDYRLKTECGSEIFKMLEFEYEDKKFYRPESITSKGKRQITEFIENILSTAITKDWPVYPPDPDLRR